LRLLLDSNVLLWPFADRNLLTSKVLQLIEDDTNKLVVIRVHQIKVIL
jgi:PIN domain nuclease of toxin-antitoxin system